MQPDIYPINDFGPIMKGLAIGGLGIFHVFLAQFAIGGGFLVSNRQSALRSRTSVGGATDLRRPVRSATGGQCRRNTTCDLLPNNDRNLGMVGNLTRLAVLLDEVPAEGRVA